MASRKRPRDTTDSHDTTTNISNKQMKKENFLKKKREKKRLKQERRKERSTGSGSKATSTNPTKATPHSFLPPATTSSTTSSKSVLALLAKSPDDLIVIDDFLPPKLARAALRAVKTTPPASWQVAKNDPKDRGAAVHRYRVGDGSIGSSYNNDIEQLLSLVGGTALPGAPESMVRLQLGRYESGDQIAPHDDAATQKLIMQGGGPPVKASRRIAVVYYLTKDWTREMGGSFVDLHRGKSIEYVPQFNRLVAFNVPRLHSVQPVTANRPRYSVFGWLYRKGSKKHKKKKKKGKR